MCRQAGMTNTRRSKGVRNEISFYFAPFLNNLVI